MFKNHYFAVLTVFFFFSSYSQHTKNILWQKKEVSNVNKVKLKHRSSIPNSFKLYQIDLSILKQKLKNVSKRKFSNVSSGLVMSFPLSNGELQKFRVYESSILHPDLQKKYPQIRTYAAQGIDDPTATMRFSITQFGLHAMMLSGKHNAEYIDPYTNDGNYVIVYSRSSIEEYRSIVPFECSTDEGYHIS